MTWKTKSRLALLEPDIVRAKRTTDPNLAHTAAHLDDESLAEYITRKVGEDFLENYLEPFFRANWNWEPEDISKGYFLSLYPHLGRKLEVFTFKDGVGLLTRTLAARLDVRLDATVERIEPRSDGPGRTLQLSGPSGLQTIDADLVIFAAQANQALRVVSDLSDSERAFFSSVRYTPLGIVHYVLNRPPRGGEQGGFYARSHPSPFAIYRASEADPANPEKPHRLYCELTPQRVHEFLTAPGAREAGLDAFVRPLAMRFYPALDEDLAEVHEQWWDEMLCAFYPGYIGKLAGFLAAHESARREVYFAGDYLSHSHTGGACASGRRAARLASKHWRLGVAER
jgi:oxygen-dependent protoporphyrinogen oxidase